jgi:hypothetical protein
MDPQIWEESKRTEFPWSLDLRKVIQIAVLLIIIAGLLPIGSKALLLDIDFWRILIITLVISGAAYALTDRGIAAFKQRLCDKNLFGKDLNKLGD